MADPLPDLFDVCFLDIETTGLDPHREKIALIRLASLIISVVSVLGFFGDRPIQHAGQVWCAQ